MAPPKIGEVLGYNASKGKGSESITRRYYITADTPAAAKNAFQNYAAALSVPDGLELNDAALDEEKNADGMYFGTITFASPNPKIKTKIADDLFEVYGEKLSENRKSASHERKFRVKAVSAAQAKNKLENYIRSASLTSGRLHISDIAVDEEPDGDGFFGGTVLYNNPDHKGQSDKFTGYVPSYGSRWTEQYENGTHIASAAEDVFELRGYPSAYSALLALRGATQNNYVKEISV